MKRTFYTVRGKRMGDIAGALIALLVLSPIFLAAAIAIKLDTRGPILYRQERIGLNGRRFRIFKFRSMVVGAEYHGAGMRVEAGDSRVTRVGRVLRRLSVDEFPQLLNVLAGDVSLVGPRPAPLYQVEQYDDVQRKRLTVRPGMTGWAQIHGRNDIPWDERIRLDLEYVDRMGPGIDCLVLLRTIPVVLGGRGRIAAREYWKP